MGEVVNLLLAGTGGQGIVLASRIIAWVAFKSGFDVKESEIHGMAQRGGSVIGQVRFGPKVYSPSIPLGHADIMLALEEMEALRYLHYLKPEALVILHKKRILPPSLDEKEYPQDTERRIIERGYKLLSLDVEAIAKDIGSSKVVNSILLGVLSLYLPFTLERWEEVISQSVPAKTVELNLKAFREGRTLGEKILSAQN